MSQTLLKCQCGGVRFTAMLTHGVGTDTRTYLEVRCTRCQKPQPTMMFVVDLTPEFERFVEHDGQKVYY